MIQIISSAYDRIVLDHPRAVLMLMGAVLIFFASGVPQFKLDASADSLLLDNDEDLRKFREVAQRYETREFLFATVTPREDLFSQKTIELIRSLRDDLRALDTVHSIRTMLDLPLVKNVPGTLADAAKNSRTLESPDVDIERARLELTTSPLYRDFVVDQTGKHTALQIFLQDDPEFRELQKRRATLIYKRSTDGLSSSEKSELEDINARYRPAKAAVDALNHKAVADIRGVMQGYGNRVSIHLGGVPMIADDMITFIRSDLITFGTGVFVFVVLMLAIIFRELRWIMLPLASCIYSGILMIGLLGLVGWNVTVISSNFISLMLIITMSMNIHLVVRYRELFRDQPGATQIELVRGTMGHMVRPCLYTALTTIIAFASLLVSGIKPVIDFGWMMTIGLVVVFVTSFTLFPALLLLTRHKPLRRAEPEHYAFTGSLGRLTERHGLFILVSSAVVAVLGGIGISRLQVENSFISYFHKDTEIYQGLKLIDEQLGGTTPMDIVLRFPAPDAGKDKADTGKDGDLDELFGEIESEKSDYWFTPDKIDRIKLVHDYLDSLPEIGKVLSLATVVRIAEDLNEGREFDAFELNVINKRLPQELKRTIMEPYVSIDNDEARITVRVRDSLPDLRRKALLEKIDRDLQKKFGLKKSEYSITGLLVLYNNMLQSLFRSQILTLGVVMCGIMLTLWFLFRSFTIAVIGIIPNMLAATTILGLMGWLGIALDMMTITIAAITIGIAVDDCIHYLYRYREERPVIGHDIETMHYCHANIAKAAFYTTVTVMVGFSILVLSNFIPTILFGFLTAVAMTIALLAALTLMPKLILAWRPFAEDNPPDETEPILVPGVNSES